MWFVMYTRVTAHQETHPPLPPADTDMFCSNTSIIFCSDASTISVILLDICISKILGTQDCGWRPRHNVSAWFVLHQSLFPPALYLGPIPVVSDQTGRQQHWLRSCHGVWRLQHNVCGDCACFVLHQSLPLPVLYLGLSCLCHSNWRNTTESVTQLLYWHLDRMIPQAIRRKEAVSCRQRFALGMPLWRESWSIALL